MSKRSAIASVMAGVALIACATDREPVAPFGDAGAGDANPPATAQADEAPWQRVLRDVERPWPQESQQDAERQVDRINRLLAAQPAIVPTLGFYIGRIAVEGSYLVVAHRPLDGVEGLYPNLVEISDITPRVLPYVRGDGDSRFYLECWRGPPTRPAWSEHCWGPKGPYVSGTPSASLDFDGDPVLGEAMLAALEQLIATLQAQRDAPP